MVAIGVCPSSMDRFDRTSSPVRYFYVDLSKAVQVEPSKSSKLDLFRKDVQDLGRLLDNMLVDVSPFLPLLLWCGVNSFLHMIDPCYSAEAESPGQRNDLWRVRSRRRSQIVGSTLKINRFLGIWHLGCCQSRR